MDASLELPSGYRLRRPRPDEAATVDRLNAVCDAAVGSPPSLTEDLVVALWGRPGFDLATDAWVVELGGDLVGYGQVWREAPDRSSAFAFVHPDHLGRGIGTALATLIEERAAAMADGAASRLFSAALTQNEAGARLLAARGYAWARRFWHMEAELPAEPPAPTSPPGIRLRPLDPERDLPAAHRILEEAFRDHWDQVPRTYEGFLEEARDEGFDPDLWVVALDGDEPVGVLWGSAHSDRGWVGELGVLRSHRGRGIATALLRASFAGFARRGLSRVRLNVDSDNPTGAVSLYERVGMRVESIYDLWELGIEGRASPTPP